MNACVPEPRSHNCSSVGPCSKISVKGSLNRDEELDRSQISSWPEWNICSFRPKSSDLRPAFGELSIFSDSSIMSNTIKRWQSLIRLQQIHILDFETNEASNNFIQYWEKKRECNEELLQLTRTNRRRIAHSRTLLSKASEGGCIHEIEVDDSKRRCSNRKRKATQNETALPPPRSKRRKENRKVHHTPKFPSKRKGTHAKGMKKAEKLRKALVSRSTNPERRSKYVQAQQQK